jgi:mannose-6-phosphate isomerase-like protein (cupin superfamily)
MIILYMMKLPICVLVCSAFLYAADDRVKVDNDSVRILKAVDVPGHKSALHRHEFNRVMIYLDAGEIEIVNEDGHKEAQHWKADQVAWSPAGGQHTSENVGRSPLRIVEIELKKPAPASPPVRKRDLDPVAIDPKHYHLLFENSQVRVFRSWLDPGASEPMHEHMGAGRATVLLTDMDASVKLADGTASELKGARGDAFWSGPVTHYTTNRGSKKSEVVVVEVK